MKKFMSAALAAVALTALSAPAFAQAQAYQYTGPQQQQPYYGGGQSYYGGGQSYNNGSQSYFDGYQSFDELYQHDAQMIQHGVRDGAYTRREGQEFMAKLRQIQQRELSYRGYEGYLDANEGADIQRRLERLHNTMHVAHENGHDEQDQDQTGWNNGWNNYGNGYYPQPRRR